MLLPSTYPVTCHTQYVGKGSTFVAIKGHAADGVSFIPEALAKGATKIVVSRETSLPCIIPEGIEVCHVDDTRKALAELSRQENGFPDRNLTIIGITGTAGKTTTTQLIRHILSQAGYKTALMGGIHNYILDETELSKLTTQSSDYLYTFLAKCVEMKVTHLVMEVSSHALCMDRVHGLQFAAVGFTNLAAEHLDYHATINDYFDAKLRIFSMKAPGGIAVINTDDAWGHKAFEYVQGDAVAIKSTMPEFDTYPCPVLLGHFNKYNVAMAAAICAFLGVSKESIVTALRSFPGVLGRMQLHVMANGAQAFVDFAHKPSSFEVVLKTLRPMTQHLIVVFGCGGNRDRTKRPVMGALAVQYADQVIITNDNPRFESPDVIIQEIMAGISHDQRAKVSTEKNRTQAIKNAVAFSKSGSVIALLGKGHEEYYEVAGQRTFFSDYQEISQY